VIVTLLSSSVFALPESLAAKTDPRLVGDDEQQFAAIAASLEQQIAEVGHRLDVVRRDPAGTGRRASDRDLEIHRLSARLRLLRRFGSDVCLGRSHRQHRSSSAGRLAGAGGRAVLRRHPRPPPGSGQPPPVSLDHRAHHRLLG
jgi:hypothetical protein